MKLITTASLLLCLMLLLSGCSNLKTTQGTQELPIVIDENSEEEINDQNETEAKPMNTSDDVDSLSTDLDATVISDESFQ